MAYQQQQRQDVVALEKYSATLAAQTINWLTTDVAEGKIKAIPGYDAGTEITTAMLKLTQVKDRTGALALTVCTKESVISAIRDMAIQGLSMTRSQCYPIVYGNQLQIQRSYFGTLAVFGRMFPNLKVNVGLVHKGDEYEFGVDEITGCNYIIGVKSSLESLDSPIIAAYGSLIDKTTGEQVYSDVMTWKQIQTAWSHAKTDKVQKEFPDQMAKRTLINRLCKLYVNAFGTTDNSAMMDSFIRTTQNEYQEEGAQEREATKSEEDIRTLGTSRSQGSSGLKAIL